MTDTHALQAAIQTSFNVMTKHASQITLYVMVWATVRTMKTRVAVILLVIENHLNLNKI